MKNPEELKIGLGTGADVTALVYAAERPPADAALILAHGAGAGQHSPFLVSFARALAARGLDIITFNFLYTEQAPSSPRPPAGTRRVLQRNHSGDSSAGR